MKTIRYVVYLLIVIFLIPEISLRIAGFHGESDKREFIQYHEKLGWSLIPDIDAIDSGFEWKVKYHINEDGIRGRLDIGNKEDSVYRILILGDSFSEGLGIQQHKRFSYLTETMCNKNNKDVEVINAGVRGYNLTQYHILFQSLYKKYKPDLLIIAVVTGDLDVVSDGTFLAADIVQRYYRPYYNLKDEKLMLKGVPVPKPDRAIYVKDKIEFLKRGLRKHSALYGFLRIASDGNIFLRKIGVSLGFKKGILKYPQNKRYLYIDNKELNERISTFVIKDILDTLKQNGGSLLTFLLKDDKSENNADYFSKLSNDLGFFYASFSEISHEYRQDKRKYYFRFDPHFNEKGNKLVAEALYSFLNENVLERKR